MSKIYTKVGDKGQTALVGGQKVSKDDLRLEAYGSLDELNAVLGVAQVSMAGFSTSQKLSPEGKAAFERLAADLAVIQHWLFNLGSLLATLPEDRPKFDLPSIEEKHVLWLEKRIDEATAVLPPLKNFILPGGSKAAGRLHVARTVARRAERAVVRAGGHDLPAQAIPFVNRLSDYLFTMARYCNFLTNTPETLWDKNR